MLPAAMHPWIRLCMTGMLCTVFYRSAADESLGDEACNFSLLQARLVVEQGLPELTVVGKSYFSLNALESAGWFSKYVSAELEINPEITVKPPGSIVVGAYISSEKNGQEGKYPGDYKLVFMEGTATDPDSIYLAEKLKSQWAAALQERRWSAYGDFHDGTHTLPFNFTRAALDNLSHDWFYDPLPQSGGALARFYVPGLTWTWEFWDPDATAGLFVNRDDGTPEHLVYTDDKWMTADGTLPSKSAAFNHLDEHTWHLPQSDRNDTWDQDPHTNSLWWKVAYGVSNASMAREFALDVIGAKKRSCPYSYPPDLQTGASGGYWTYAIAKSEGGMEMHFIESGVPSEHDVIAEYHTIMAEKAKGLALGCWHPLLYNTLIFDVDTLDPFVNKLNSWGSTFLAIQNGSNDYALIIPFPQNEGVVVQLRSSVLTATRATRSDQVTSSC